MDRRTFFKMSALSPMVITSHPMRTARAQFTIDETVSAQIILTGHSTVESAESWRKGWETRAFEGEGEWYLQTTERLTLPDHLADMAGTLMKHQFVIGYAAEERTMLVGTFRRVHVACVVRVLGDHQEQMLRLAEWFGSRVLPSRWELAWSGAHLQHFIPTTDEFGGTIEPNDGFWP